MSGKRINSIGAGICILTILLLTSLCSSKLRVGSFPANTHLISVQEILPDCSSVPVDGTISEIAFQVMMPCPTGKALEILLHPSNSLTAARRKINSPLFGFHHWQYLLQDASPAKHILIRVLLI